jgi:hypothetical protein
MRALVLALTLTAQPVLAEVLMTPEEFETYTTGKTLTYAQGGLVYGIEEYLPGRQVRWAFAEGECETGRWYVEAEWICFTYESTPDPQCWQFFRTEGGLMARFRGDAPGSELSEIGKSAAPLNCPGPDVGA